MFSENFKISLVKILPVFASLISCISATTFIVETEEDLADPIWRQEGMFEYFHDGKILRGPVNRYFPDDFRFSNFALSKGIWAVFPNDCPFAFQSSEEDIFNFGSAPSNEHDTSENEVSPGPTTSKESSKTGSGCDPSSSGIFHLQLAAQLIDTVTVKYCLGGKSATLTIGNGRDKNNTFVVQSKRKFGEKWTESKINMDGSSVELEASVNTKGDYALIDRIEVKLQDGSTTTINPPTFTHTSTDKPPTTTTYETSTTQAPTPRPTKKSRTTTTTEKSTTSATTPEPTTSSSTVKPEPAPISGESRISSSISLTLFLLMAIFVFFKTLY